MGVQDLLHLWNAVEEHLEHNKVGGDDVLCIQARMQVIKCGNRMKKILLKRCVSWGGVVCLAVFFDLLAHRLVNDLVASDAVFDGQSEQMLSF
jgi:hypothetical protein